MYPGTFYVSLGSYFLLKLGLPEAVEVAVLIYGHGFATTGAYLSYGLILEVNSQTTILKLHIHEGDVMLGEHWVLNTAYLDEKFAIVDFLHNGEMFLLAGLYGVCYHLSHLLATAEGYYAAIYSLNYYITTSVAFIEFSCHNFVVFECSTFVLSFCLIQN